MTEINGLDIQWLESGDGSPCLMLHGLAADGAQGYEPVMAHLPERHCFAPWARGHGKSQWADRYLIDDYAADSIAFVEDVVGEPVVVVGFSLGSMVAAYMAVHRPDLVRAIFLEDSPLLVLHDPGRHEHETYRDFFASFASARREMMDDGHDETWLRDRVASFTVTAPGSDQTYGDLLPLEAIDQMAHMMAANDPAVVAPAVTLPTGELVASLPPDDLTRITCPVTLLAGRWQLGGSLPQSDLERWHELIPHARSRQIDGAGHAIRRTPHAFPVYLDELDRFLSSIDT